MPAMPPADFLHALRRRGVSLHVNGDWLCVRGPEEARKPAVEEYLRRFKPQLVELLRTEATQSATVQSEQLPPRTADEEGTGEIPQFLDEAAPVPEDAKCHAGVTLRPKVEAEPLTDPFDDDTPEDLLRPFTELLNAALDGELPDCVIELPGGGRVLRPNDAVVAYAKDLLACHCQAGEDAKTMAAVYLARLSSLSAWWDVLNCGISAVGPTEHSPRDETLQASAKDSGRSETLSPETKFAPDPADYLDLPPGVIPPVLYHHDPAAFWREYHSLRRQTREIVS